MSDFLRIIFDIIKPKKKKNSNIGAFVHQGSSSANRIVNIRYKKPSY